MCPSMSPIARNVCAFLWVTRTQKNEAEGDVGGVQAWWGWGGAVGWAVEVVQVDVVFK